MYQAHQLCSGYSVWFGGTEHVEHIAKWSTTSSARVSQSQVVSFISAISANFIYRLYTRYDFLPSHKLIEMMSSDFTQVSH